MRTNIFIGLVLFFSSVAQAEENHQHGADIFHAFRLEADSGWGKDDEVTTWDLDGWVGGPENKLWLKSEGEIEAGITEQAELWALYSRNVAQFWDAQIGVRQDIQEYSTTYLALGVEGLAYYYFETEAHVFVSDDGDFSARVRQENDLLLTQRLILQPYLEATLFFKNVAEQEVGEGLSAGEIGWQLRYELTRKFAPYIDVRYERLFGETSTIARREGENTEDFIASIGLRLMF
jgi:copper resistance protein B